MPMSHRLAISKPVGALIYHISQGLTVNLGQIIFDHLAGHASSKNPQYPIGHPSILFQLIIQQAPDLMTKSSDLTVPKPLIVDWKLFAFEHIVDVSVPQSIMQTLTKMKKTVKMESSSLLVSALSSGKSVLQHLKDQKRLLEQALAENTWLINQIEQSSQAVSEEEESEAEEDFSDNQ